MVSPARIASGSSSAQRIREDDAVQRTQFVYVTVCASPPPFHVLLFRTFFFDRHLIFCCRLLLYVFKPGQGSVFIVCHRRVKKCQISEKKSLIATSQLLSGYEIVTSSSV